MQSGRWDVRNYIPQEFTHQLIVYSCVAPLGGIIDSITDSITDYISFCVDSTNHKDTVDQPGNWGFLQDKDKGLYIWRTGGGESYAEKAAMENETRK